MGARSIKIAALAALLGLTVGAAPVMAAPTPERRARLGIRYLVRQQNDNGSIVGLFNPIADTADAILAMVAARRGPDAIQDAIRFLRRHEEEINDIGEKAKMTMALIGAGRSPRSFANRNLVAEIKASKQGNGQYGNNPFSAVLDHALAMLALTGSDVDVPRATVKWLAEAQCPDGGWAFDQPHSAKDDDSCLRDTEDFTSSDTNTTGYAVMALNARSSTVPLRADPFAFFDTARDPFFGGWIYSPSNACETRNETGFCYRTDASSTALVLQAYAAEQQTVPEGGESALMKLQVAKCGSNAGAFASGYEVEDGKARRAGPNTFATIQAVPALMAKPFPLRPTSVSDAPPSGRC